MTTTSLPSLLLLLTTTPLLFGEGQAAFLRGLTNPGISPEDSPIGQEQSYKSFWSYPLKGDKAKYQTFENHKQYHPQDRVKVESPFIEVEQIAAVTSYSCEDEYGLFKMIDCCQVQKLFPEAKSEILTFKSHRGPGTGITLSARCDMDTDGGGWTVIQRRVPNGGVNFTRDWANYENGFGDLNGEFWYGLKNLHCLTTQADVELRIDMVKEETDTKIWWTYQTFKVAGAEDKYRLTVGGGQGTDGADAMAYHDDMPFSTYEQDNDQSTTSNCAYRYQAGWWYNRCYYCNLNGPHRPLVYPGMIPAQAKPRWMRVDSGYMYYVLSTVEMKIRVKNCHKNQ